MLALAALSLVLLQAAPSPDVVERVLAVADGRPVLLSEVRAAQRVRGEDTGPALEALVDELLMFAEASRLPQARVTADEEERALAGLRAALAARGDTDDGDVAALRRMARRQAVVLKYVDFRFRPQVRVTDEAVQAALRARQAEGADAQDAVRRALEAEDLDRRIEAWVADLRRAAAVRYNPPSR
jgi:hypothetical protein